MEDKDKDIIVGAVVVIGGLGLVVGGPVVGVLGAAATAGVLYLKQQQEEQSQQTTRIEKSRQDSSNHRFSTGQRQQQTPSREEPRQYNPNPQSSKVPESLIPRSTKQSLVLVISAAQVEFLESLRAKRRIDMNDGERLYEITKYLWLGSENDFNQGEASINQYSVSEGEESEYDIYLICIELNKAEEGLKSNVNQLDRYDAFRNLANLAIKFKISPRLQMEAYENFEVYNR
jgi:hypothetical protein